MSDPLSQAMALTAIVIGLAVTALLLVLVLRVVAGLRVARARRGRGGRGRARRALERRHDGSIGRRRRRPGDGAVLSLVIPWIAGIVLALLDGRRALVGWVAVAALAAKLGALVVTRRPGACPTARSSSTTGNWPVGIGITLRADALGVIFALLSSLVLLAAAVHEVLGGVREREFPGLVVLLAGGPQRACS